VPPSGVAAELTGRLHEAQPNPRGGLGRTRHRRTARQHHLVAALALVLGALILSLALPRLLASALMAMRDPVIQQMDAGEPIAAAELLGLAASRELALGWVEDREAHLERATALAQLALQPAPEDGAQKALLERAVAALRAGLAAAPADPRHWVQLAHLLVLLEGDLNRRAAAAALFSVRVGAFHAPDLMRRRLFWVLAHWTFYDEQERRQIAEQIRLAWRTAPGEVADLALNGPEFQAPVESALEDVPEAEQQFLAAVAFATPHSGGP
jgi:hypothetical protein